MPAVVNSNPIPIQERSVDPYSSYDSNVVNKLTRIISDGLDTLLLPSPMYATKASSTLLLTHAGKAIKDDVLIEIQDITINMADPAFYVNTSTGIWNEEGIYYLVLSYQYQKTSPPPVASVLLIKPSQRLTVYNPILHLFINAISVINLGGYQIDTVLDFDPEHPNNKRVYAGGGSGGGGGSELIIRDIVGPGTVPVDPSDSTLVINTTGGNVVLTLPLTSTINHILRIVKISADANTVTVNRSGSDTIEGAASIVLPAQFDAVSLMPYTATNIWIEV